MATDAPARREGVSERLLEVSDLKGWYGESQVLHGVDLFVGRGEVVSLVGRNGAGKTSTLKSIIGIIQKRSGSVRIGERETIAMRSKDIARLGLGYVPEDRGIYASLTVKENLLLPPAVAPGGLSNEAVLDLFPNLRERLGNSGAKLSGGEQQMLAIGRVLTTGASLLLFDEPTEGLAPVIVQKIGEIVADLKARGFTILIVEQNMQFCSRYADRHYVIEQGRVVDVFDREGFQANTAKVQSYLGV
ncbi:MAG: ABC transporter ATP-binding protein [Rhizobiaceae bacterium]